MNGENCGFYLGSSAAGGFFSIFDELFPKNDGDWYTYILKGGPGTGKSTLMRSLAAAMEKHDIVCERIFCSSDPSSLDAVIFPQLKASVVDGTAPHTLDPEYPGVTAEIINLGCWDGAALRESREKITALSDKNRYFHAKCRRFLDTGFGIYSDAAAIERGCIDWERVERYAARIAARLFPKPCGRAGTVRKRLLEAVTPEGCRFMNETAAEMCDKRFIIIDDFGAAARAVIELVGRYAAGSGLDVLASPEIACKGTRHIIIPELRTGFFTSDCLNGLSAEGAKNVHTARFVDSELLRARRARLSFSRKAVDELLCEAVCALTQAGAVHEELEKCYIQAMDYARIDEIGKKLFESLWARSWHGEPEEE